MRHRAVASITPSSTFAPTDIAGLIVWLDADDASTFTYSSSTIVSQWNDKSGGARHFAQSDTVKQPNRNGTTNGRTTVVFDGNSDCLRYDAGSDIVDITPWTFFAVIKDTAGNGFEGIFSARRSASGAHDYQSPNAIPGFRNNANAVAAHANGVATANTKTYSASTWFLFRSSLDGSNNILVAVDSSAAASTAASAPSDLRYLQLAQRMDNNAPPGGLPTDSWGGEVAEVIMYNAALSAGDITSVESFLRTRWGTP